MKKFLKIVSSQSLETGTFKRLRYSKYILHIFNILPYIQHRRTSGHLSRKEHYRHYSKRLLHKRENRRQWWVES